MPQITRFWSVIRTELAHEKAVARAIIAKGYQVCQLFEVRYIRQNRHAKRKRTQETNILPGKVIALIPDIAMDEMGDIPNVVKIARDGQGEPWRIPEPQVLEFEETLSSLNAGEFARLINEAERDNEARRGKKPRRWVKMSEWKEKLGIGNENQIYSANSD